MVATALQALGCLVKPRRSPAVPTKLCKQPDAWDMLRSNMSINP
jgi:hypothetical protein